VTELIGTGHRNTPRETPDAAAQVTEGVAIRVFDTHARILMHTSAEVAAMYVGPTTGIVEPSGSDDTCIVTIGGDVDWIARYLVGLPVRFEVLEPTAVRDEIRRLARQLLREHRADDRRVRA